MRRSVFRGYRPGLMVVVWLFIVLPADRIWADDVYVVGALGDSITRAFNSGGVLAHPENSWSTGGTSSERVWSHYQRIRERIGGSVRAYNAARSGAKSADLMRQVGKLLPKHPDYVTLLIGANDVCDWPESYEEPRKKMEDNVRRALDRLIRARPDVVVVMAPIPDMYHLYEVGVEAGCSGRWQVVRFCSRLLGANRTESERLAFAVRWEQANRTLRRVADEFSENVVFVDGPQYYEFEKDDISPLDCFHPSVKGQNLISDLTWQDWLF